MYKQRPQEGQGLTEYAILLALLAVVVVGILTLLGPGINALYARVIAGLNGQVITASGQEVVIVDFKMRATGGAGSCNVDINDVEFIALNDGQPMTNSAIIIPVSAPGAAASFVTGTTDGSGTGLSNMTTLVGANCPGAVTVGGVTRHFFP